MSGKLVLVTGVTGFIAGHVADQLLQKGYRVRGTVRDNKVESLRKTVNIPGIEFTRVDDIAKDDLSGALEGVDIIIHVASPLANKASPDDILSTAIEGTLHVVGQAEKAGIEKIVVTSSYVTLLHPSGEAAFSGITLTESNWGEVTIDETRSQAENPIFVYCGAKILAEKALWDFARHHPKLDIATILPGFVFGPYVPYFPYPSTAGVGLGTNSLPHAVINGVYPFPKVFPPYFVDVRDVAKAHVLAIDLPRAEPEEKRFIVNWGNYTWKQAAEYLRKAHPSLTNVVDPAAYVEHPGTLSTLDTSRSQKVLGLEYISPEKTLNDFVENIKEVEKGWAAEN
ncbi:hypothetical protein BDQ17DRAFT_1546355 [Cyathus striatus]|nr:hypothetical protein BDQ17DRAFT_1546355 [Cyathus striatus]